MYSPTYGKISDEKMIELIGGDFIEKSPDSSYNISVGTDSQNFKCTKTVVVVAIHRVGNGGGIFFYDIKRVEKINNLSQKLFFLKLVLA